MDTESAGADWKQEERVLAVVAYRIEKVSQCLPKKIVVVNLLTFWLLLGLLVLFQNWATKHWQKSYVQKSREKNWIDNSFHLIFSFENGSDSFF